MSQIKNKNVKLMSETKQQQEESVQMNNWSSEGNSYLADALLEYAMYSMHAGINVAGCLV